MPMVIVIELFKNLGMRFVLVIKHGKLVGILTKKDVLRHMAIVRTRAAARQRTSGSRRTHLSHSYQAVATSQSL